MRPFQCRKPLNSIFKSHCKLGLSHGNSSDKPNLYFGGKVEIEEAVKLLRKLVKYPGTIDQKHIDLTLAPVDELPKYEEALKVSQMAIKEGKMTREEFLKKVKLA